MPDDLAAANTNRSYTLAGTSITVFTFSMVFLYPKYLTGDVDSTLFQVTLLVMAVATFAFVLASFHYYGSSLGAQVADATRARYARRGNRLWLLGYSLLFLEPSLVLFTVGLPLVASAWLAIWLVSAVLVIRNIEIVRSA